MRRFRAGILSLAIVTGLADAAYAEKRAFVVGINGYSNIVALKKAVPDATSVSKALEQSGFKISRYDDVSLAEFNERWGDFLNSVSAGDTVAFYFAGHGVQVDTLNYLLPKNVPGVESGQAALLEKSVNFHELMERLQLRRPAIALYILDACRDDPFNGKRGKGTLGQAKGLARLESVYNTFVMYSAGPDESAYESNPATDRTNSVYINQLLPLLSKPESTLVETAKQVQTAVYAETKAFPGGLPPQRPAYFDGIIGDYILARGGDAVQPDAKQPITGDNIVRLGAFATWDGNCQPRPAPRVSVTTPPKLGRILLRFEGFSAAGKHFGAACEKSKQRGIAVYYIVDEPNRESTAVDRVKLKVKHWSTAPATSVDESFEIDLATRFSRRTTSEK